MVKIWLVLTFNEGVVGGSGIFHRLVWKVPPLYEAPQKWKFFVSSGQVCVRWQKPQTSTSGYCSGNWQVLVLSSLWVTVFLLDAKVESMNVFFLTTYNRKFWSCSGPYLLNTASHLILFWMLVRTLSIIELKQRWGTMGATKCHNHPGLVILIHQEQLHVQV